MNDGMALSTSPRAGVTLCKFLSVNALFADTVQGSKDMSTP